MELDTNLEVNEEEIDDLGIKKKDNDDDDLADDSDTVDPLDEDAEKDKVDEGIFGDDKELEDYMLAGYDEND
jgi:hypothetical protein